jgi:hypothetical protein
MASAADDDEEKALPQPSISESSGIMSRPIDSDVSILACTRTAMGGQAGARITNSTSQSFHSSDGSESLDDL